jgi:hypothetical protein
MYDIMRRLDGKWAVSCRIQDGTEHWVEDTREKAIHSLISAARSLNGTYIREDDIMFEEENSPLVSSKPISIEEEELLSDIRRGAKKVLDFNHYLLRYRITEEEADMLINIREGKLRVQ